MLKGRYFVFDARRPDGATVKLWVDGRFEALRVVDGASFARLQAIWKSRTALLPAVLLPTGAVLLYLYGSGGLTSELLLYVLFAALLVDLMSRAMLAWHERRTIGALPPRPIPPERAEAMRAAAKAGDVDAVRSAAAAMLADVAYPDR